MPCSSSLLTSKGMIEIQELFNVEYPSTLVFNQQVEDESGVPFVSSKGKNNGIAGRVRRNPNAKLYPKGSITVPLKGTVLSAFLQAEDFHCAHQTAVLCCKEKYDMSESQKLFYVLCIRKNTFRYNYGRQADNTLKRLLVPKFEDIPGFIDSVDFNDFDDTTVHSISGLDIDVNNQPWKWFRLEELFDIKKGRRLTKAKMTKGKTPFVGAINSNNGYREYIGQTPIHSGGTISVNYNGSVAEAFYQPVPYWASDDCNVLYPLFKMTPFTGIFICTLIRQEKYRFNYGRKWHMNRMKTAAIRLPVEANGNPDWLFMESYIQSLPYSINLVSDS